ncbi:asparaginase [Candidatus Woesearchaeota archaeon]|nr:asparaginase [Candidatus Woesearchaeota archaeon]
MSKKPDKAYLIECDEIYRRFIEEEIPEPKITLDWTGKPKKPRVLLLYTGGTLGMKKKVNQKTQKEELVPDLSLEQLCAAADFVAGIKNRYNLLGYHVSHVDSTEINVKVWKTLAGLVHKHYEEFDGVVVLHGTDTLQYTSAATAFSLRNLAIPVVHTAAQMILQADGSDVLMNLTGSLAVATSKIAESCALITGEIYKGTRLEKVDDSRILTSFGSPIYGSIGHLGSHGVVLDQRAVVRGTYIPSDLIYAPEFETSVLEVVITPGLSPRVVDAAIDESECKALVMRSFGPGNMPRWFIPLIRAKASEGYPVYVSSQCAGSGISAGGSDYAVGQAVLEAGGVPIGDMSPTATTVKLMKVMGYTKDNAAIKREMVGNIYADEITHYK